VGAVGACRSNQKGLTLALKEKVLKEKEDIFVMNTSGGLYKHWLFYPVDKRYPVVKIIQLG